MAINQYMFSGMPIIITTRRFQARKHKKRRINKKWLKRYGVKVIEVQDHNKPFVFKGKIYMTEQCYYRMKGLLKGEEHE